MFSRSRFIVKEEAILKIGNNCRIHGTCIHCYKKIDIGDNVLIAANTQIMESNGHDLSFENVINRINMVGSVKPIKIMNNVWIGTGIIILPDVTIGEDSVITANSVVGSNISSFCLAGGNPAIIIKKYAEH
jgi:acetyltransferase-like isoleucine patch superfamily enzyme